MKFIFEGSVPSELNKVKTFVEQVLNKIENVIHDEDLMFDIRLILNELIINGVIHGNECNENKDVYLLLKIRNKTIRIEVVDEGQGFEYNCTSYDPEELKCCGRGLVLVEGLTDEVQIVRNRIVAIKHIP